MYLHIGNGNSLKKKDIIGIFDLDTSTVSSVSKRFINSKQKEGSVEYDDSDIPRSFVFAESDGKYKVILSRISTAGLRMRVEDKERFE